MFSCTFCSQTFSNANDIIVHLKKIHKVSNDTSKFNCVFQSCTSNFLSYKNFKSHLKTHNREVKLNLNVNVRVQNREDDCNEIDCTFINDDAESQIDLNVSVPNTSMYEPASKKKKMDPQLASALQHKAAKIFCKFYAIPTITKKTIQSKMDLIEEVSDCSEMVEYEESIFDMLKAKLSEHELQRAHTFYKVTKFPLKGIFSSDHQRMNYFNEQDTLIPFNAHHIAYSNKRNRAGLDESTSVKCYTFDLNILFRKYLELPNVFATIKSFIENTPVSTDTISSFHQGKIWQKKISNFGNDLVIPLSLFIDDFEPNNALGSKSKIHKTGGVYLSIAALPTDLQTMLNREYFYCWASFCKTSKGVWVKSSFSSSFS